MDPLTNLPLDLKREILKFLEPKELTKLAQTSKANSGTGHLAQQQLNFITQNNPILELMLTMNRLTYLQGKVASLRDRVLIGNELPNVLLNEAETLLKDALMLIIPDGQSITNQRQRIIREITIILNTIKLIDG